MDVGLEGEARVFVDLPEGPEPGGRDGEAFPTGPTSTFLFVDVFVGLFVMLASPKRKRPGDMAAGILVVRKKS